MPEQEVREKNELKDEKSKYYSAGRQSWMKAKWYKLQHKFKKKKIMEELFDEKINILWQRVVGE